MQAYLMDNENLGLLGFMSVPGFGGIVHMPYHGGIKQMMALNIVLSSGKGSVASNKWCIQQSISYTKGRSN